MERGGVHVASFSETWLKEAIPNSMLNIAGYQLIRQDRTGSRKTRGGGLCVYVRDDFLCDSTSLVNLNRSSDNHEMLWITLKPGGLKKLVLGVLYKPPDGKAEEFLEDMKLGLDVLENHQDKEIHLLGDFNLDVILGATGKGKELVQMCKQKGLIQLVQSPTRVTPKKKSIIDLYFTNCQHVADSGLTKTNVSDHSQIFMRKKKAPQERIKSSFKGRIYKSYDSKGFSQEIQAHDWGEVPGMEDCNDAWERFNEVIKTKLDKMCPLKDIKIKKVKVPWLTSDHLEQIKLKDDLLEISRTSGDREAWIEAQKCKNRTKAMMKQAKSNYLTQALANHQKDSKAFWRTLKTILL